MRKLVNKLPIKSQTSVDFVAPRQY